MMAFKLAMWVEAPIPINTEEVTKLIGNENLQLRDLILYIVFTDMGHLAAFL
jgi:hypothetical protein